MDAPHLQACTPKVLFLLIMQWIYFLALKIYSFLIGLAAPFNSKAALWIKGRVGIFKKARTQLNDMNGMRIWIHCASLGEYEQAVPLLEKLKQQYPSHKIILTFFSPSGYELKKNTALADAVFYLPMDSPSNARKFMDLINPVMALFIKYEFWHFYICELYRRNIPLYIISARFRPNHIFFKWYGTFFQEMLKKARYIFVQDEISFQLCIKAGIKNCSISGDTRFDRVMEIAARPKLFPEIEKFCSGKKVFVAGSTWPEDERILIKLIHQTNDEWKFIIAPHEINEKHIRYLISEIRKKTERYSIFSNADSHVLIIDNIGMLSSIYRFGHLAFVGGGFGSGLHNILEPAAFGLPVIFGNCIEKNPEAKAMIQNGTGFFVRSAEELFRVFENLKSDEKQWKELINAQKKFIAQNSGAVKVIMNSLS